MKTPNVQMMQPKSSYQSHVSNEVMMEEESFYPTKSLNSDQYNDAVVDLVMNDFDYSDSAVLKMLQKAVVEKDLLPNELSSGMDTLRSSVLQQLRVLRQDIVGLQDGYKTWQEEGDMQYNQKEKKIREISQKIESTESTIKNFQEENREFTKEVKEKEKQIRKLKTGVDQHKHQLSSHQQGIDRVKSEFEAKRNIEEVEKIHYETRAKELQQSLQKQEDMMNGMERKKQEIEQEKKMNILLRGLKRCKKSFVKSKMIE